MNAATEILIRRAPLAATSWNPEERTFEVVFSTGAAVKRQDARGPYIERLDLAQDWSAFIGAPVLDSHRRGSRHDVLGSVQKAWTVDGGREARAIMQLSRRDDVEPVIQDILDGHIRGVSAGYEVHEWSETSEGGRRVKTATRWTALELSIVPIPADRHATIRGETMTAPTEPNTTPAPTALPAAAPSNPTASAERAVVNVEIRSIGSGLGLDQAWIDSQIDAGATAEAAALAAVTALQARSAPLHTFRSAAPTITTGQDHTDPVAIRSAMADALAHEMAPAVVKLEDRAMKYRGYDLLAMAGDLAHARGDRVNLRDRSALMERAIGAHSTSDFPLLLADAANKALMAQYEVAAPTYRKWATYRPFTDFKEHSFLHAGDFPAFKPIGENGEVKYGTISESSAKVKAKEYGTGIAIGRQMLINDDLSALSDFTSMIAIRAAQDENRLAYGVLAANAALPDTVALFHAGHGNLAASGGTIDATPSARRLQPCVPRSPWTVSPSTFSRPSSWSARPRKLPPGRSLPPSPPPNRAT